MLLHVTFPNDYSKSVFYIDNVQFACLLFLSLDTSILCGFVKIINYKLYSFFFYFLLLFFFPLLLPASISFSIHLFLHPSFLYCFLSLVFSPPNGCSLLSFFPPILFSHHSFFFKFFLYSFIIVLIFFCITLFLYSFLPLFSFPPPSIILFKK